MHTLRMSGGGNTHAVRFCVYLLDFCVLAGERINMVKQVGPGSKFEKIAIGFTNWVGSISSLVVHTLLFALCFVAVFFGVSFERMLLALTTVVSLEAIYLAIFIQMTVNRNTQSLEEVEEDIDEIQADIDEVQKDVDEIQEDVEDITEGETAEEQADRKTRESLDKIETTLGKLIEEIEKIKGQK